MIAAEILAQVRQLPPAEQRELAECILDECGLFDDALTSAQLSEFERRAEGLRRNPQAGIPWEQVRAELKSRIQQAR